MICVATYLTTGRRKQINKIKSHSSPKEKTSGSRHQHLFKENIRKTKRGMQILKRMVRELFTRREGISTLRVRYKGRQPLIECAIKIT